MKSNVTRHSILIHGGASRSSLVSHGAISAENYAKCWKKPSGRAGSEKKDHGGSAFCNFVIKSQQF